MGTKIRDVETESNAHKELLYEKIEQLKDEIKKLKEAHPLIEPLASDVVSPDTKNRTCQDGVCWINHDANDATQEQDYPLTMEDPWKAEGENVVAQTQEIDNMQLLARYQRMVEEAQRQRQYENLYFDETDAVANVWNTLKRDVDAVKRKTDEDRDPLERQLVELFDTFGEKWKSLLVTDPPDEKIQLFPPDVLVDKERAEAATRKYKTLYAESLLQRSKPDMHGVWNALQEDVKTLKKKTERTREENALLILFTKHASHWKRALNSKGPMVRETLFPNPIEIVE